MKESIMKNLRDENGGYIFPFLWLHGEDEARLRQMMRVIHESGISAVCLESRPHPDFCGKKWWEDLDILLDEAQKRGMKVWILDDSHFPTGFANGAMKGKTPSLRRQGILCRSMTLSGGGEHVISVSSFLKKKNRSANMYSLARNHAKLNDALPSDQLLGITAFSEDGKQLDLTSSVTDGKLKWTAPSGRWTLCIIKRSWNCGAHPDYINMLSPDSCRILIDTVYEPHYARYQSLFGAVIAGFFSDEPELGNGKAYSRELLGSKQDLPWSSELEEALEKCWGKNWRNELPYLWENTLDAKKTALRRSEFMEEVTRLAQHAFSQQIGRWCTEHGVQYIGHLVEDMGGHARTGGSLGHYFRGLWGQHMAGIDDIGGQVMPQGEDRIQNPSLLFRFQKRDGTFYHYELARLASSLAALDPKKQGDSMCEIFGNYGWLEGLRLERYLADHFMVCGINHFVPHAFTAKAFPDRDCPPHFYADGHNPQYLHFKSLMLYMNRVCRLISDGVHVAPVAVLYHAESEWAGKAMADGEVLRVLSEHQINADLVPLDAFTRPDDYRTVIGQSSFTINTQEFRALIIPYAEWISMKLIDAVNRLQESGVPVVFAGAPPKGCFDADMEPQHFGVVALNDLPEWIRENDLSEISLENASDRLRYLHYRKGGSLYHFVNEGSNAYCGRITVPEKHTGYVYNAWLNRLETMEFRREEKGCSFLLELDPLQSCFVIFDDIPEATLYEQQTVLLRSAVETGFSGLWTRSLCHAEDYPAFSAPKEVSLPDTLAKEKPRFSGWVLYENSFSAGAGERMLLEITDAREGVEVFVNGLSAGVQITPPYRFELGSLVREGLNELRIEVSTTLERERAAAHGKGAIERVLERRKKAPTGITGEVKLYRIL